MFSDRVVATVGVMNGVDALFAAQDGLATRAQLIAAGVPARTVDERCRHGMPWVKVLPGVVAGFTGALSERQRHRAAVLWAGPGAVLAAGTAASVHGLTRIPQALLGSVHLLLPHGGHTTSPSFVAVRRSRTPASSWTRNGLPVADPARAVIDACRQMTSLADVRALVAEAVQEGRATPARLDAELSRGGSAGSRLVRTALCDVHAGVRSAPEAEARDLVGRSDLPEPAWNYDLYTRDGIWIARPDGWWTAGVAFEADSREYHFAEADWQATMLRHERMSAYGIIAIHASPSRIHRHGRELVASIWAALRNAARHAPPPIIALPPGCRFQRPA